MSARSALRDPETGPFGPPDGARADLDEIETSFVTFADRPALDDLASPAGDRSARLIVGKKGVGKTVYLRRFQANARREGSVYADAVHHDVPATEDVIRVCELYPVALAAEGWQWIWRRAIFRALVSHIVCRPELRRRGDAEAVGALEEDFAPLLTRARRPRGVYAEARAIVGTAKNRDRLARELRHPDWEDIEALLAELLVDLPPICFYLDSVDEQFGSAPMYWLQCQKGLCLQILELSRDPRFGSRLHVVASVRDLVRSSLLQGEHATRYRRSRHIRVLDWDHQAIRYFLREKIRRLPSALCMTPAAEGVPRWLGRAEIYNPARGVTESVEDYLLRHTRRIPRDVVQLGNEICREVAQAQADGAREVGDDALRHAVGAVSRECADEQIAVCANHLAADFMPPDAGLQGFSDFYTSPEYSLGLQDELRRFIRAVGTDRCTMAGLQEALDGLNGDVLRTHPNPLDVLWVNGLLGYEPAGDRLRRSHFYDAHDEADFQLPRDVETYVFHPVVGHSVRIAPAGDRPVRPFS